MPVEGEQRDGALLAVMKDQGDGIRARGPDREGGSDRAGELGHRGVLEKAQHLDELPGAGRPQIRLQPPAKQGEAPRQFPGLQRPGDVEGTGLSLEKCQVVAGIEARLLFLPRAGWRATSW